LLKLSASIPPLLLLAMLLAGCESAAFYRQAIAGQMEILQHRRPIAEILADPASHENLKQKLSYIQAVRRFAERELGLPVGNHYRSYVALDRPYVVWNVFAAPEFSLRPKTWCYPLVGCTAYRAYFDKDEADGYGNRLRAEGYDIYIGGVRAYSTLGWFDDPVLSTFVVLDNTRLAGLIFHELAHQILYVRNDTTFNESFATTVELEGIRRWQAAGAGDVDYHSRAVDLSVQREFLNLIRESRHALEGLYRSDLPAAEKRERKNRLFATLRENFETRKNHLPELVRYEGWFATPINNARIAGLAAYHDDVPAFRELLRRKGNDLLQFYEASRKLAAQSPSERRQAMDRLARPAATTITTGNDS
jgi:predicted aminopeptidase